MSDIANALKALSEAYWREISREIETISTLCNLEPQEVIEAAQFMATDSTDPFEILMILRKNRMSEEAKRSA